MRGGRNPCVVLVRSTIALALGDAVPSDSVPVALIVINRVALFSHAKSGRVVMSESVPLFGSVVELVLRPVKSIIAPVPVSFAAVVWATILPQKPDDVKRENEKPGAKVESTTVALKT